MSTNQLVRLAAGTDRMLSSDIESPLSIIEDGPFRGTSYEPMPPSFEIDRKDLIYQASDEDPRGDMLHAGDREYCLSPRALEAFTSMNGLKKPTWFIKTFDAETRSDMARQAIAATGNRKLRLFYRETPDGPTVLSMLDSRRPVMADVEVLELAVEVFGGEMKTKLAKRADGGMNLQLLAGDAIDLLQGKKKSDMEVGDLVEFGIQIRNSQLGFFSPHLDGFMERLTCKNGATTNQMMDAWSTYDRDKSLTQGDLKQWFYRGMLEIRVEVEKNVEKCLLAMETSSTDDLLAAACAEHGLSAKMMQKVYSAFMKEPGKTVWSVANAFTLAAHSNDFTMGEQMKLERIGGELIFA